MFINNTKISSVLEQGGTVVVPSRQRAAAIRLAHTVAQLDRKLEHWGSCDVLPWSAWLERMAATARHGALRGLRRLSATEEWLAWRAASVAASASAGMLMPASLADALRRSAARVRDGALQWPGSPTSESALLRQASASMARVCRERGAVLGDDWPLLLRDAPVSPVPLLLAGFEELGPALKARLAELGAHFDDSASAATAAAPAAVPADELVAASDRDDELRRAAQWSRRLLERDAGARLLVIVPQLAQCRAMAIQAFEHALNGSELLSGLEAQRRFAVEGGVPLTEYPLVAAALALLALGSEGLEFAELATLLRGSFLRCGTPAARAALELRLRDRNVLHADVRQLLDVVRTAAADWSGGLESALGAMLPALTRAAAAPARAGDWARHFAAQLALWGWPGTQALDSAEQQQRERFETLLGEFATLDRTTGLTSAAAAVQLLRAMAARTRFEAATDDTAVTISAESGDPLVHYDGIWVTGLDAERWPAPAQPDPFIPLAVQRAAQLPGASPEGQLMVAKQRLAAWRARAGMLVLSQACNDGDVQLQPSRLLPWPDSQPEHAEAPLPIALEDPLLAALRAGAVLEPRPEERALVWPAERNLPGGTRALDLQAACPFRALAELRLEAAPLPEPRPGLDPRERGQVLHQALEHVWRELKGSAALRRCDAAALQALARQATTRALSALLAKRSTPLPASLQANESARTASLIVLLLEQEKARADFSIDALEASSVHGLAGAQIKVRMDRVDRLDDGRYTVIDYKSGTPLKFDAVDERPQYVQLLAYAALMPAPLAGVAGVHLRPDGIAWRGAAEDVTVFPLLAVRRGPPLPWVEVLPFARRVVAGLVSGFVSGDAAVAPRAGACEHCHLPGLCRIDSTRLALEETAMAPAGLSDES